MEKACFAVIAILLGLMALDHVTHIFEPKDPVSRLVLEGRRRTERGEIQWQRIQEGGQEYLIATIDGQQTRTDLWNVWIKDEAGSWLLVEEANARSYDFGLAALRQVEEKESSERREEIEQNAAKVK